MITLHTMTSAISLAINKHFGDDYEIYKESIDQNLNTPCFSVVVLNPTVEAKLYRHYRREFPFVVHYFPKDEYNTNGEIEDITEQLFTVLELIDVQGDLVRGVNMHAETTDNVLSFFVEYDVNVYDKPEDGPIMEEADLTETVDDSGSVNTHITEG